LSILTATAAVRPIPSRSFVIIVRTSGALMADAQARKAAIKKASQQVRAGGVFSRASATSKVSSGQVSAGKTLGQAGKEHR
jgi:hypothetical protein